MAIHRVLIERHEHVELVAVAQHGLVAGAEGQEDVTAANDGLVGIVGVHVKPAADEDPRQDVAGGGDTLTGRAPDTDSQVDVLHDSSLLRAVEPRNLAASDDCGQGAPGVIVLGMARLKTSKRARLPDSAFAYVDSRGERRLPVHDKAHVRNALARFNQVVFEEIDFVDI